MKALRRVLHTVVDKPARPYLLWVAIAGFFLYFSFLAFARHDNFYSLRIDLGNMNQTVWNVVHGNGFTLTDPQGAAQISRLGIHADFLLALIAPLYMLWQDPRMLLLLQACIVSLGALPVFWIAADILRSRRLAYLFAAAYLLYPPVERIMLHDFHAVALSMTFLLFAYWYMHTKRYGYFVLFAVLAGLGKEHIWATTGLMGLYIIRSDRNHRLFGAVVSLLSFLFFYLLLWHAIPAAAPQGEHFALSYLSAFGATPGEIVTNIVLRPWQVLSVIVQPDRLTYYFRLLSPVAFLPVMAPFVLLFAAPSIAINVLSNNGLMRIIDYQYTSDITPFLFVAAIYGFAAVVSVLRRYGRNNAAVIVTGMVIAAAGAASYAWGELPYGRESRFTYFTRPLPENDAIRRVEAAASPVYTVSASNNVGAHFSGREFLYTFPVNAESADIVVVRLGDRYAWPSGGAQQETVDRLFANPAYELLEQEHNFYAFKKKDTAL